MTEIDPDVARKVSDAARRVTIAKAMVERAKTFEERKMLQIELDAAESEMQNVAMLVNRGVSRAAPSA